MTPDTIKILGDLLLSDRLGEIEAMTLQAMMRKAMQNESDMVNKDDNLAIALSDRDNRMRRMQIAHAILDETQVYDLDAIAEIIWPNPLTSHEFAEGVQQGSLHTQDNQPIYRQGAQVQSIPFPDISAPTRVSGEGECPLGGKHQWKLVTGAGQDNCACGAWRDAPLGVHHFLDDGVTPRCKASYNRNQCIYTEGHSEDPHMDHASFEW